MDGVHRQILSRSGYRKNEARGLARLALLVGFGQRRRVRVLHNVEAIFAQCAQSCRNVERPAFALVVDGLLKRVFAQRFSDLFGLLVGRGNVVAFDCLPLSRHQYTDRPSFLVRLLAVSVDDSNHPGQPRIAFRNTQ